MQKITDVIPIFILGSPRSGTTWLGNCLCCHPAIVGAHHRAHWGQIESNIYQCVRFAGDLADDRNLIRFLELYSACDYFQMVEGDKQFFYENRPKDFLDLFLTLMDQFARKKDAGHWVTKLDTMYSCHPHEMASFMRRLDARYEQVRFIAIKRRFEQVLTSYLRMEGRHSIHGLPPTKKRAAVLLESARYVIHDKAFGEIVQAKNCLALDYNEFKDDHEESLRRICAYLSLDYSPEMTRRLYPPNSSFLHKSETREVSTSMLWLGTNIFVKAFELLPVAAKGLLLLRDATRKWGYPFYWRLLRLRHMKQSLAEEFQSTGELALHRMLFGEPDAG